MNCTLACNHRFLLLSILVGLLAIYPVNAVFAASETGTENNSQKTILVTGASTGLGRKISLQRLNMRCSMPILSDATWSSATLNASLQ